MKNFIHSTIKKHSKNGHLIAVGETVSAADFTGLILMWGGSSAPAGWLSCDGSAVSRTTYDDLFAVIGTTYGAGDGSTTFNLPDLRGSVPVGKGQKPIIKAKSTAYTNISIATDIITFTSPHGFQHGDLVAITSSGNTPLSFNYWKGVSSGSVAVDGSGNISVGSGLAAVCPVGSPVRCTAQTSTNFSAGTTYWVISNNGSVITVSATKGGSIHGSGNSGSATFQQCTTPAVSYSTSPCSGDPQNSDWLDMAGFSIDPEIGDMLVVSNQISLSPFSNGQTWYIVDIDFPNTRFKVSSSLGGSPQSHSGSGWVSFNGYREKVFVGAKSDTTIKLYPTINDAIRDTNAIDLVDEGTGTVTFNAGTENLTNRALGDTGGAEKHRLNVAELASHYHSGASGSSGSSSGSSGTGNTGETGGNEKHNNMPPFVVVDYIIKT